jgi:UDP-N-acetylmuramyl pentapeptide phosphotransferase/UDP-N-acetylglucosamine-1-phosphate transferase
MWQLWQNSVWLIIGGFSAFILTFGGIFGLRQWLKKRLLDIPNERSSHTVPTPRGAGIVVVVVTILFLIFSWQVGFLRFLPLAFVVGAVLIALISWIDDWRSLPSWWRFAVHFVGAMLAVWSFGFFEQIELPFLSSLKLGWWGIPLTILWLVGLTNIYNFMDGIDGIAGTQALVGAIGLLLIGISVHNLTFMWLAILIFSTSAAFLCHNWSPAKIFLGDVGSAFWGFLFAAMPLWIAKEESGSFFWQGLCLVWIFVFDGILTIIRRALRGENIFLAHRSHLYQRLVIAGFSHQTVTVLYGMLAITGVCALVAGQKFWSDKIFFSILSVLPGGLALWFLTMEVEKKRNSSEK